MRRLLIVPALLFFALAARADNVTVRVHESVTIDIAGATAAYAIDPSVVDVTITGAGHVAKAAAAASATTLVHVSAIGADSGGAGSGAGEGARFLVALEAAGEKRVDAGGH